MAIKKAKATIKKVASKLKKASKAHAGQATALSKIKLNKGGSTVNSAGNYTKPTMRKRLFSQIKSGFKGWWSWTMVCEKSPNACQTI
jgi:hypothetical protein